MKCVLLVSAASAQYYEPESSGKSKYMRRYFPGAPQSVFFKGSFNSTYNPYGFRGPVTVHPDGLREQSFLSSHLDLKPGEVVNNFVPINWPEGKIRIKSWTADVVKLVPGVEVSDGSLPETKVATRQEVYLHHWTVDKWQLGKEEYDSILREGRDFETDGPDAGQTHGANGPCGPALLHFLFAAGNDVRGPRSDDTASYSFPDPYGIESDSEEMHDKGILMLLNLHLIDLRGVDDVRGCTECDCEVMGVHRTGKGYEKYIGGLECCHSTAVDGGRCPSIAVPEVQSYLVKYTLTWRDENDVIYSNQPFKPLNVMTLDQSDDGVRWYDPLNYQGTIKQSHDALHEDQVSMASLTGRQSGMQYSDAHLTPLLQPDIHGCHVEYFVPACESGEACEHRFRNSWIMPFDMHIVAVYSHLHGAAINMTTSVEGGDAICTSLPKYKDGFLVDTSRCGVGLDFSDPVYVERDQGVVVETFYAQDERPHFGVMGYSFLYVHRLDLEAVLV